MKTSSTFYLLVSVLIGSFLSSSNAYAQPANDLIQNAINIGNGPIDYFAANVDFPNATSTGDGNQITCPSGDKKGIWYKFKATTNGSAGGGIVTPSNPRYTFYTAPDIYQIDSSNLVYVEDVNNNCQNNNLTSIIVTTNTSYYVFVSNDVVSNFYLNAIDAFGQPANDLIENAISLNNQTMPFIDEDVHFLMATDTNDDGQNGGCDTSTERVVWYKFTADQDGMVNAFFEHNVQFNALIFYSAANANATSGADLTYVNQVNNPCDYNNEASIEAEAGTTYYIAAICSQRAYNNVIVDVSLALSVNENQIEGFSFYPNPVQNELHLKAIHALETITIYNLMGQVVYKEKGMSTNTSINMETLTSGLYMMEVSSQGKKATYKVIKK